MDFLDSNASYIPGTMAHDRHWDVNINVNKGKKPVGARLPHTVKTGLALNPTRDLEGMLKTGSSSCQTRRRLWQKCGGWQAPD
jgi:hypothetical protein